MKKWLLRTTENFTENYREFSNQFRNLLTYIHSFKLETNDKNTWFFQHFVNILSKIFSIFKIWAKKTWKNSLILSRFSNVTLISLVFSKKFFPEIRTITFFLWKFHKNLSHLLKRKPSPFTHFYQIFKFQPNFPLLFSPEIAER